MSIVGLYYDLKRLMPRRVQVAIRRWFVRMKRRRVGAVWPILESAGPTPPAWKGWPDGKKFAFVLTHDVETIVGHDRCLDVMRLEASLGFRSAFFFVPKRYTVSPSLRRELADNGCEVGAAWPRTRWKAV